MKIVQVCPFYVPHPGGVESHVRRLSTELVREGHEVTVLTSRYDPELPAAEVLDGVHVVRVPVRGVLFNTPIDPRVGKVLRTLSADIVHLHYPPPLTSYFAARGLRPGHPPVVLTYHCDLYLPGPWGRLLTSTFERVMLPQVLRVADRIIVHTKSYGQTSANLRNRAIDVVPSLVDVELYRTPAHVEELRQELGLSDRRILVFTGRLVPHKGFDTGIRALSLLPKDVTMLVIGSGPNLPALASLARRLRVAGRVRFLTHVGDGELPRYLALGDVFVYPSQNRLEGFGLAIAEAMAAGLPVVIADMPGVREVIEEGREGLLAHPMIPEDFARQVQRLLDDREAAQRMGAAGRLRAQERYGVATITRQIVALYESLRNAPPRSSS